MQKNDGSSCALVILIIVGLFILGFAALLFLGPILFGFISVMPPYLMLNLALALGLVLIPLLVLFGYRPKPDEPLYLRWVMVAVIASLAFGMTFFVQAKALAGVVYQYATTSLDFSGGFSSPQVALMPNVPPDQVGPIKLALTWRYLSPPFLRPTCTPANEASCPFSIQVDAAYAQPVPPPFFDRDIRPLPVLIGQCQAEATEE